MAPARDSSRPDHIQDPLGNVSIRRSDTGAERVLHLRDDVLASGLFDFAVRERVARLSAFRHRAFVAVRRVERVRPVGIDIVSDVPEGVRLRDIIAEAAGDPLPVGWRVHVVEQLLGAVAALHDIGPDVAHGLITADRIFVDEDGHVSLTDYVLALAVQQLRYSAAQYTSQLRIPLPGDAPQFDQQLDLYQIGRVAADLLASRSDAGDTLDADALRMWLSMMTDTRMAFRSAREAHDAWVLVARECEPMPSLPWVRRLLEQDATPASDTAAVEDSNARVTAPALLPDIEPAAVLLPVTPPAAHRTDVIPGLDFGFEPPTDAAADTAPAGLPDHAAAYVPARRRNYPKSVTATVAVLCAVVVLALVGRVRSQSVTRQTDPAPAPVSSTSTAPSALVVRPVAVSASKTSDTELPNDRPVLGTLNIGTEPAGITVTVDGRTVGRSPITMAVAPGQHRVAFGASPADQTQTVMVQAGATTMLIVPLPAEKPERAAPAPGWMELRGPIEAEVLEDGRVIATTQASRVMLPAGTHRVEIVNAATGFHESRAIDIVPGRVAGLTFDVPAGVLAVNAAPWADVWVDGQSFGTTPLGNISVPIGTHEVIFRHPSYGEQRRTVVVPVKGTARLSLDFTKGTP
jgi:hypothetical protein